MKSKRVSAAEAMDYAPVAGPSDWYARQQKESHVAGTQAGGSESRGLKTSKTRTPPSAPNSIMKRQRTHSTSGPSASPSHQHKRDRKSPLKVLILDASPGYRSSSSPDPLQMMPVPRNGTGLTPTRELPMRQVSSARPSLRNVSLTRHGVREKDLVAGSEPEYEVLELPKRPSPTKPRHAKRQMTVNVPALALSSTSHANAASKKPNTRLRPLAPSPSPATNTTTTPTSAKSLKRKVKTIEELEQPFPISRRSLSPDFPPAASIPDPPSYGLVGRREKKKAKIVPEPELVSEVIVEVDLEIEQGAEEDVEMFGGVTGDQGVKDVFDLHLTPDLKAESAPQPEALAALEGESVLENAVTDNEKGKSTDEAVQVAVPVETKKNTQTVSASAGDAEVVKDGETEPEPEPEATELVTSESPPAARAALKLPAESVVLLVKPRSTPHDEEVPSQVQERDTADGSSAPPALPDAPPVRAQPTAKTTPPRHQLRRSLRTSASKPVVDVPLNASADEAEEPATPGPILRTRVVAVSDIVEQIEKQVVTAPSVKQELSVTPEPGRSLPSRDELSITPEPEVSTGLAVASSDLLRRLPDPATDLHSATTVPTSAGSQLSASQPIRKRHSVVEAVLPRSSPADSPVTSPVIRRANSRARSRQPKESSAAPETPRVTRQSIAAQTPAGIAPQPTPGVEEAVASSVRERLLAVAVNGTAVESVGASLSQRANGQIIASRSSLHPEVKTSETEVKTLNMTSMSSNDVARFASATGPITAAAAAISVFDVEKNTPPTVIASKPVEPVVANLSSDKAPNPIADVDVAVETATDEAEAQCTLIKSVHESDSLQLNVGAEALETATIVQHDPTMDGQDDLANLQYLREDVYPVEEPVQAATLLLSPMSKLIKERDEAEAQFEREKLARGARIPPGATESLVGSALLAQASSPSEHAKPIVEALEAAVARANLTKPAATEKRARRANAGTTANAREVEKMVADWLERMNEPDEPAPGTLRLHLTTLPLSEMSHTDITISNRESVPAMTPSNSESQIETPDWILGRPDLDDEADEVVVGVSPSKLRHRANVEDLEDTSDERYAAAHKRYEAFEKRQRLREKEKLTFERHLMRTKLDILRTMPPNTWQSVVNGVLNRSDVNVEEGSAIPSVGEQLIQAHGIGWLKSRLIVEGQELLERYDQLLPGDSRHKKQTAAPHTLSFASPPTPVLPTRVNALRDEPLMPINKKVSSPGKFSANPRAAVHCRKSSQAEAVLLADRTEARAILTVSDEDFPTVEETSAAKAYASLKQRAALAAAMSIQEEEFIPIKTPNGLPCIVEAANRRHDTMMEHEAAKASGKNVGPQRTSSRAAQILPFGAAPPAMLGWKSMFDLDGPFWWDMLEVRRARREAEAGAGVGASSSENMASV